MQHAILITAYKNLHHLKSCMDVLDKRFQFHIHFDASAPFTECDDANISSWIYGADSGGSFSRHIKVNWAGFNHLRAMLDLMERGLQDPKNKVFHMISGQDFPIKSSDEIIRFFENNRDIQFMENFPMPAGHWTNGGMHRIWHWYFFDAFNNKSRAGNIMNRAIRRIQMITGIRRKWPATLPPLHGGGSWWSITRECAEYIVNYGKKYPQLLQRLRYTLCPEELYFQTIVMNSPFAGQVISDHKRFIDWNSRNGNSPANLDITDLDVLLGCDKLFSRKFEYPTSAGLCDALKLKLSSGVKVVNDPQWDSESV